MWECVHITFNVCFIILRKKKKVYLLWKSRFVGEILSTFMLSSEQYSEASSSRPINLRRIVLNKKTHKLYFRILHNIFLLWMLTPQKRKCRIFRVEKCIKKKEIKFPRNREGERNILFMWNAFGAEKFNEKSFLLLGGRGWIFSPDFIYWIFGSSGWNDEIFECCNIYHWITSLKLNIPKLQ